MRSGSLILQLDTNAVRALIEARSGLLDALARDHRCCLSAVVAAEIRFGLSRLPASSRLHGLVGSFLASIEILPWTSRCADVYGPLRRDLESHGRPLACMDLLIATHALACDHTLVSADRAFHSVPQLSLIDWNELPAGND